MMKAITYIIPALVFVLLVTGCRSGPEKLAEKETYTCPMHPEIIKDGPGSCPICGMDLVKEDPEPISAPQEVSLDQLLQPANEVFLSSVPVTAAVEAEKPLSLTVPGTVSYDPRQAGTIAARVNGRIERLYVRYKFQTVSKGQKILEIYSPELATAQQDLLFLLRNDPSNKNMIAASGERLLLLGLTRQQVKNIIASGKLVYAVPVFSNYNGFVTDIEDRNEGNSNMQGPSASRESLNVREGSYLQKGQPVFSVYNTDRVWVLLNIYPEMYAGIKVGDNVVIESEIYPGKKFREKIRYIEPVASENTRTLAARIYFDNSEARLPVGSRVTAIIDGGAQKGLWIPKEAVLSLGNENIVFVRDGPGFRARKITVSNTVEDMMQVTGGITRSDSIAVNARFLADNEAFIKVKK